MDSILTGYEYAKSAIDMACWDILGKSVGLPLCDLWGGRVDAPMLVGSGMLPVDDWYTGKVSSQQLVDELRLLKEGKNRDFGMKASGDIPRDI